MRPHQKLEAWTKSVDLVIEVYKASARFPKEEMYGLTSQIRRAAVSVPANIAEGAGRQSTKEFAYFVSNAQDQEVNWRPKILAHRLGYLSETLFAQLMSNLDRIGRLITGLSRHIRAN